MPCKSKESQAASARKHYLNNKEAMKKRASEFNAFARARNRKYVWEYKSANPCVDCKESNPIVLQFDHISGVKEDCIANMVKKPLSLERIKNEIGKCVIRCANCHLKRHFILPDNNFQCGELHTYRDFAEE